MKNFEDLTIADDYMFCTVMQDEKLCKTLLSMVLKNKIGKIEKIIHQAPIDNQIGAKGIRLDIMIQDETGKIYDIEMQTTDQKNLPKRMRYYQCAIDSSILNKGKDYNDLPDTFIIFFCTFDYINKGLPIYTLKTMASEVPEYSFQDGVNKIIINSQAARKAEPELKAFLEYMNGKKATTTFTEEIENKINNTKKDENRRREYMLISSFEMDAKRDGIKEGITLGIKQGISQGISQGITQGITQGISQGITQGITQATLKTVENMRRKKFDDSIISEITGLSIEEIKKLKP